MHVALFCVWLRGRARNYLHVRTFCGARDPPVGRGQKGSGAGKPEGCWRGGPGRASGQSADTSAVPDYVATSLITRQPATILDPTAWNEAVRGPSPSWLYYQGMGEERGANDFAGR